MHKAYRPHSEDPTADFEQLPDVILTETTLQDAWFVIGMGLDGVILTADHDIVADPSCFRNTEMSAPGVDLLASGLPVFEMEDVFVGFDGAWWNYYHYLCYGLSKCFIANPSLPKRCEIVIPDYASRVGSMPLAYTQSIYDEALVMAGLSDRVTRLPSGLYHSNTLRFLWTTPCQPTDMLEVPNFYDMFASIRSTLEVNPNAPRFLLVSRDAGTADPRITAEQSALVREKCLERGFTIVRFETMTLKQQASAVFNAECLIAPHGAGLMNILFGQSHLKVLELGSDLNNDGSLRACFYQMAAERNQTYMVLNGSRGEINAENVEAALAILCGARETATA